MKPNRLPHLGLFALALAGAGCNSVHEAYAIADGTPVAALPPMPYRVVVEPVERTELLTGQRDPEALGFVLDADAFQQRLQTALREEFSLASSVLARSDGAAADADLKLKITVSGRPEMAYEGTTTGNTSSVLLWLFTIFGGGFVDDCRYRVAMPVSCDLIDARTDERLYQFAVDAKYVDTRYWDRVTVPGGLLWSLSCLPHCFVSDNLEVTSTSLSEKATNAVAAGIAKQLKASLGDAAFARLGRIEFAAPVNGGRMPAASLRLNCKIHTADLLREVLVYLGTSSDRPMIHLQESDLRSMMQREPGGYVATIDQALDAGEQPALRRGGDNFLQIRIKAGSVDATRTLRVVLD